MHIKKWHSWNVSTTEAHQLQKQLVNYLEKENSLDINNLKTVAATDISFSRFGKTLYGALVRVSFPELKVIDIHTMQAEATFPYVPGYLSFREAPVILEMFREIENPPDVLLCDGQGIAHPRGLGLASHLGLFLDIPTIGCAKSVLVGEYEAPAFQKGSFTPLTFNNKTVGAVLRTRAGVKPVFVSIGHKINLQDAIEIVLQCSPKFRIPEPLRKAHQKVNEYRMNCENK